MKKLILTASLMVVAVAAFGQGQLIMNNNSATRLWEDRNNDGTTNGPTDSLWAGGPTSQVAVYGLAGSDQPAGSLVLQTTAQTNLFAAGLFAGGTRTLAIPAGPASVQVRAWSGSFPNYEAARAAALGGDLTVRTGSSSVLNITLLLPGPTPANGLVGAGLTSFGVAPVPEPSSIALGLLGLGAIVLFRRRK